MARTSIPCRRPSPDQSGPWPARPGPTRKRTAFPGPFAGARERGGEGGLRLDRTVVWRGRPGGRVYRAPRRGGAAGFADGQIRQGAAVTSKTMGRAERVNDRRRRSSGDQAAAQASPRRRIVAISGTSNSDATCPSAL